MKRIENIEEIRNLKPEQELIRLCCDDVKYYTFLCVHPHNDKYVILINKWTERPERFYFQDLVEAFAMNYTNDDIISYRLKYHKNVVQELENVLSEQ